MRPSRCSTECIALPVGGDVNIVLPHPDVYERGVVIPTISLQRSWNKGGCDEAASEMDADSKQEENVQRQATSSRCNSIRLVSYRFELTSGEDDETHFHCRRTAGWRALRGLLPAR